MGNHTVKKRPAGLKDKTIIVGMQINQTVKEIGARAGEKTKQLFELEAKGKLYREVVPTEYMVIKEYSNTEKDKTAKKDNNTSKSKKDRDIKGKEDDPIK